MKQQKTIELELDQDLENELNNTKHMKECYRYLLLAQKEIIKTGPIEKQKDLLDQVETALTNLDQIQNIETIDCLLQESRKSSKLCRKGTLFLIHLLRTLNRKDLMQLDYQINWEKVRAKENE